MKRYALLLTVTILALFLACAGCASNKPVPVVTPVPTTEPTPVTTTIPMVTTTAPEPVVTLPPNQEVNLELTKDRTYSDIILHYNGGQGLMFVQKIMMRVIRSDGTIEEKYMHDGQKPQQGDEIVIHGTPRGSDRCEVYVTSAGTTYKVKDQFLMIAGAYEGN